MFSDVCCTMFFFLTIFLIMITKGDLWGVQFQPWPFARPVQHITESI